MLNAAFPVGVVFTTFTSSGFSPVIPFRYVISASYNAFVTVLLPTPAPPLKNSLRGSSFLFLLNVTCDKKTFFDSHSKSGQVHNNHYQTCTLREVPHYHYFWENSSVI